MKGEWIELPNGEIWWHGPIQSPNVVLDCGHKVLVALGPTSRPRQVTCPKCSKRRKVLILDRIGWKRRVP